MVKRVVIAGGGTGGHIYPGVAIAKAIQEKYPGVEVHFVGARGGLEEKIVPRENFPLHLVKIGKLHKSVGLLARFKTLFQLPLALFSSAMILRRLKPVAVLGVGGFASGPLLFAASLLRYRTFIWEPNAHPGLANRWLAPLVDESLLVFKDAAQYMKSRRTIEAGIPVRDTIRPALRESHTTLRILVFGGSQGARAINNVVSQSVAQGGKWLEGVEIVHQTGPLDFEKVAASYANAPPTIQVMAYLNDMEKRYAWADLVVCRAGASTVSEICNCHKAAVFIPLPTAADNHQQRNAEVLSRDNAAVMILQKDFTPERFQSMVLDFKNNPQKIRELEQNVQRFQFPDAANRIATRIMGLEPIQPT